MSEKIDMDIVVCVKQVPNPCLPVETDSETGHLNDGEWTYIVNPYDEVALEEAIRIREGQGEGSVIVISLGPGQAESALQWCLAMGADDAIHIQYDEPYSLDGYATATILSRIISKIKYDLILCGSQSVDWSNGGVGIMIGELLNLPVITSVVMMAVSAGGKSVTVSRLVERGDKQQIRCNLPAVLTVKMALCEPRYPSLPKIKESLKKEISRISIGPLNQDDINVKSVPLSTQVVSISRPPPKRLFVPPSDLTPEERINLLVSGMAKQKESNLLRGPASDVAKKLVEFLVEVGSVPE